MRLFKVKLLLEGRYIFMYEMKEEYKIGIEHIDEQHKKLF